MSFSLGRHKLRFPPVIMSFQSDYANPLRVVFLGRSGTGKSSIVNELIKVSNEMEDWKREKIKAKVGRTTLSCTTTCSPFGLTINSSFAARRVQQQVEMDSNPDTRDQFRGLVEMAVHYNRSFVFWDTPGFPDTNIDQVTLANLNVVL